MFKDNDVHHVQSLEKRLEDLDSLSLNFWLTKFVLEVANKTKLISKHMCLDTLMLAILTGSNMTCRWICPPTTGVTPKD